MLQLNSAKIGKLIEKQTLLGLQSRLEIKRNLVYFSGCSWRYYISKIFSYFTHVEKARDFVRPARENKVKKE
jgi:hypothetical protein